MDFRSCDSFLSFLAFRLPEAEKVAEKLTCKVADKEYTLADDSLVPFWAGKNIGWEIVRD